MVSFVEHESNLPNKYIWIFDSTRFDWNGYTGPIDPLQSGVAFLYPPENIGGIATPGCNGLNESNIMFSRLSHHIANCDTALDKSNFCKVSSRLKLYKKEIPGCKSVQKSWNPFWVLRTNIIYANSYWQTFPEIICWRWKRTLGIFSQPSEYFFWFLIQLRLLYCM